MIWPAMRNIGFRRLSGGQAESLQKGQSIFDYCRLRAWIAPDISNPKSAFPNPQSSATHYFSTSVGRVRSGLPNSFSSVAASDARTRMPLSLFSLPQVIASGRDVVSGYGTSSPVRSFTGTAERFSVQGDLLLGSNINESLHCVDGLRNTARTDASCPHS